MIAQISSLQVIADAFDATLSINIDGDDAEMAFLDEEQAKTAFTLMNICVGWIPEQIEKKGSGWTFRIRAIKSREA